PGSAPRLMLITSAPWSTAQRIPAAISSKLPPASVSDLTGITRASGAVPATPMPLFVAAAPIPATCVPCGDGASVVLPLSQSPLPQPFGVVAQPENVVPATSLPARSGCDRSTPESTTATIWPAPVEVAQASSALICCRPHCCPKSGSFVAAAALAGRATANSAHAQANAKRRFMLPPNVSDGARRSGAPVLGTYPARPCSKLLRGRPLHVGQRARERLARVLPADVLVERMGRVAPARGLERHAPAAALARASLRFLEQRTSGAGPARRLRNHEIRNPRLRVEE